MDEYQELIERLRDPRMTVHGRAGMSSEAADVIEALVRRVEELERIVRGELTAESERLGLYE